MAGGDQVSSEVQSEENKFLVRTLAFFSVTLSRHESLETPSFTKTADMYDEVTFMRMKLHRKWSQ